MRVPFSSRVSCSHTKNSLTEQVDDAVVVAGEEPDQVLEEEDERRVDDAVVEVLEGVRIIESVTSHTLVIIA